MCQIVSFRPVEPGDYESALNLYLLTMRPLTAELMVWDEDKQTAGFAEQWRPEKVRIIQCDASDVGWLQVRERESEFLLGQFFIAPNHQRRGIGTEVLAQLLAQWDAAGKSATLTVLRNNPARWLYERFGFAVVGDVGVKLKMERQPPK